ncbi:DNA-binding winged helix-turn-helix (wHTH) protein [Bradyrhizobium sp. i1.3.1]
MRYFFEDCALDTERRELRRGLDVVPTTPQVLDLLEHLIRSRDRVVSKDDLVNAIWNGRIVSDAALTTRLNAVRRAIGDSGQQQRLIKTFPRKGFRFVGAVHDEDRQPGTTAAVTIPVASAHAVGERRSAGWLEDLRGRLKLVGSVLASVAAIGAIAGGVAGYWNAWKTVRTDAQREAQNIQPQPTVRPEIAPRLSLVVLPFASLNDGPAQELLCRLDLDRLDDRSRANARHSRCWTRHRLDLQEEGGRSAAARDGSPRPLGRAGRGETQRRPGAGQRISDRPSDRPRHLVG